MSNNSQDALAQKQLLKDAADQIQADKAAREKARPQNVGEGTLGLVGDSLGGVARGAAAVILGPVHGYQTAGPKGILGGTLGGLVAGVASTTIGIGSGIAKFAHGAKKTALKLHPSEIDSSLLVSDTTPPNIDLLYKQTKDQLYKQILDDYHAASSAATGTESLGKPKETSLYDVLGVQPDASPAQIRKSYYKLAQTCHPDKHPDNPEATAKFQEISQAYQILSDPVKREEYHRVGAEVTEGGNLIDPKAFFALMFSDFEHIVGDLAASTTDFTTGTEDLTQMTEDELKARLKKREEFQNIRVEYLVKLLNRRLELWLQGDKQQFIDHAKAEVHVLRQQPFGRDFLHTIAYIYKKSAARGSAKGPMGSVANFFGSIEDKAHEVKSHIRALEGEVKAMHQTQTAEENESIDEAERRQAVSRVGAVWLLATIDIEATVKSVVEKILSKETDTSANLKLKIEALETLATIFGQA